MYKRTDIAEPRSRKKLVLIIIGVLAALMLASFVAALRWYNIGLRPVNEGSNQAILVEIAPGTSASAIGDTLLDRGLIRDKSVYSLYLRLNPDQSDLQAGSYNLTPSMSLQEIVAELSNGSLETRNVTILQSGSPLEGAKVANLSPALTEELSLNVSGGGVVVLCSLGENAECVRRNQGVRVDGRDMGRVARGEPGLESAGFSTVLGHPQ